MEIEVMEIGCQIEGDKKQWRNEQEFRASKATGFGTKKVRSNRGEGQYGNEPMRFANSGYIFLLIFDLTIMRILKEVVQLIN